MPDHKSQHIVRICILRLSAIGDCINAAGAVCALKRHLPDAEISWIVSPASASLLQEILPDVEYVICHGKGAKGFFELKRLLKGRRFDYLLSMQYALSASIASLAVKADVKIGFDRERSLEMQRLFVDRRIEPPRGRHVADGFDAFASAVCGEEIRPIWNFHLADSLLESARALLSGNGCRGGFAVLAPCTSKLAKNWPLDTFLETAAYLTEHGITPVMIGGKSHEEGRYAGLLLEKVPGAVSLAGRTSLAQCMACVRLADLVISADTAAAHMASAMEVPVIGLYATHDPARVGPYLDQRFCVSVYEELARQEYGRDPSQLPWRTRVRIPGAMEKIAFDMIRARIDEILDGRDRAGNA